jgi:V8-like Glu-specific endopeptidase
VTSGGQAAVARATAAVFVDGRRAGSAVLVGPRYLVTAAHVLQRQDPGTLAMVAVEQVELEFPGQGPGGQPGRVAAARVDLGPAGAGADVAVLELGEDRPGWLPAPVPVWSAARPPAKVKVFGYPLAEGQLNGVWRRFAVAGPTTAGEVQMDWLGDAGTFPGHSGGPVIDADGHALAGILVEGSQRGRFDRFVPVTLIARLWPQLPRPWLITGADSGEARSHFTRRARGQRSAARGGDLFRGRTVALDRIREWLTAVQAPGQPLVLIGQPGAGKSAVLARAALGVETGHSGPGLAFHARAATIGDFLTALAGLIGIDTPASADELVTSFADLPGQAPVPVVLDALDEAASDSDRRQIIEALAGLAVLPWLRVVVATRTMAVGHPFAQGGLLPSLGMATRDDPNLIDLDSDTYFDLDGLRRFAAALLAQDGMDHPGPPGAAWMQYRARHEVRDRLAAVIAQRAGRNFLVAVMAAVPLSTARTMIDPAESRFDPAEIPSGVGEALSKYLDRLPDQRRERDRGLLAALAYGRGAGLDDLAWLAFAAALGYSASVADLDALRRSPAADYLLQTTTAELGARPVTRLFHQALTDELLATRHQPSDESVLLDMLLRQAEHTGWQDRYLREHAAEHGVAAGRLDQLLEDPLYLITVDPARLVPHLDGVRSVPARAAAAVYRQSAHFLTDLDPPTRASQLELTAHRLGCCDLVTCIANAVPDRPWKTHWSHGDRTTGHQVLPGHGGEVTAVAAGALPDGTPVIISGGSDGTVRVWRMADGAPVGEPLADYGSVVHAVAGSRRVDAGQAAAPGYSEVTAVAAGALPDGIPVIISGGDDGTVRVWRMAGGAPPRRWSPRRPRRRRTSVGEPLAGHSGAVRAVAAGALPDGTPVIISGGGGYRDGTVRVWRMADGTAVGEPLAGHGWAVTAVAAGALPDGTPVIISGGDDGTVRVWRMADGGPVVPPLALPESVRAVAVHDNVIITAAGADIAVHQRAFPRPAR